MKVKVLEPFGLMLSKPKLAGGNGPNSYNRCIKYTRNRCVHREYDKTSRPLRP